ncbi:MAG TPA: DUF2460 domain-containing protein [Bryobacteraceae bacterium]|jgi:hypothetical protein
MATFPNLKTSAVAQYPAKKLLRFQNQRLRFLDGTEQRYRDSAGPLRRWDILLNQLDEGEMAALEEFFVTDQGVFASFAFTDPWDGRLYPNCSLGTDDLSATSLAEMDGTLALRVVENRG